MEKNSTLGHFFILDKMKNKYGEFSTLKVKFNNVPHGGIFHVSIESKHNIFKISRLIKNALPSSIFQFFILNFKNKQGCTR